MNTAHKCLREKEIDSVLTGDLKAADAELWEAHLSECEQCRRAMEGRVGDPNWWHEAEHALQSSRDDGHSSSRPQEVAEEDLQIILDLLGPTDDPAMLGRIGTYEVVAVVGRGGMGVVLKAFDSALNRYVAIKMLLPHLAASGAARRRFEREGQAAAAIVDDHVLPIYAVAYWRNVPYLVMQYSSGSNLQKRLDRDGPFSVAEVLRIGIQAARGLAAAHSQGLVHRDVKPSNMLLDGSVERVLLTDFGLARAADDASVTRTGIIAGTPQYMSPEQVRGEAVDGRSDLFGLGCVLYALCAGHSPFRAESSYAVMRRITDDKPRSIRETNADIPLWLERVVEKLLKKSPDHRFESAEEVACLLESCLAHVQQPTSTALPVAAGELLPQQRRGRPAKKLIAAALGALGLILAGIVIRLELNKGTLTIDCEADNVPIRIMKGEKLIQKLTVSQEGASTRIAAGEYTITVDQPFDGVKVNANTVSLNRGEVQIVKITKTFEPKNLNEMTTATTGPIAHIAEKPGAIDVRRGNGNFANLPENTEIHAVGCFAPQNGKPIKVHVKNTGKPVVLVMCAHDATQWNVDISDGADVRGMILSGYCEQRLANSLPQNVPTQIVTYHSESTNDNCTEAHRRYERCFWVSSCLLDDLEKMAAQVQGMTGLDLTTFQGMHDAESFIIDGQRGLKELQVSQRWRRLFKRSYRNAWPYLRASAGVHGCRNDNIRLAETLLRSMNQNMDEYEVELNRNDRVRLYGLSDATDKETPMFGDTLLPQIRSLRRVIKESESREKPEGEIRGLRTELESLTARYHRSERVSDLFRSVLAAETGALKQAANFAFPQKTMLNVAEMIDVAVSADEVTEEIERRAKLFELSAEEFLAEVLASRGLSERQYRSEVVESELKVRKITKDGSLTQQLSRMVMADGFEHPGRYDSARLTGLWMANHDPLLISMQLRENGFCAFVIDCPADRYEAIGSWRLSETNQVIISLVNLPDGFPEADFVLKGVNGDQLQYKAMLFRRWTEDDSRAAKDLIVRGNRTHLQSINARTTGNPGPEIGNIVNVFVKITKPNSGLYEWRPVVRRALVTDVRDGNPIETDNRQVTVEMQLSESEAKRLQSYAHRIAFRVQIVPQTGDKDRMNDGVGQCVQLNLVKPSATRLALLNDEEETDVVDRLDVTADETYKIAVFGVGKDADRKLKGSLTVSMVTDQTASYIQHNAVPVRITNDDVSACVSGNRVVKVVFLPDAGYSTGPLSGVETIVSTMLEPGVDPVRLASERGTIVAVLRLHGLTPPIFRSKPGETKPTPLKFVIARTVDVSIPLRKENHLSNELKPLLGKRNLTLTVHQQKGVVVQRGRRTQITETSLFGRGCKLRGYGMQHINGQAVWMADLTIPTEYLENGTLKTNDITQDDIRRLVKNGARFRIDYGPPLPDLQPKGSSNDRWIGQSVQ